MRKEELKEHSKRAKNMPGFESMSDLQADYVGNEEMGYKSTNKKSRNITKKYMNNSI